MQFLNVYNLPSSIVEALTKDTYDISKYSNVISVTSLLNGAKYNLLHKRHWNEIEEDVSERIWLLLGSAVHAILERVDDKDKLIEERMYLDTDTWEVIDKKNLHGDKIYVAGKPDVYNFKDKEIHDFKVTSVWSVIYGKKEWEYQLNCYAYYFRKLGFEINKLQIVAILKDWNKREAEKSKDYPPIPIAIIDIPLWSQEKQLAYIKERFNSYIEYKDSKDDDIPECTPNERWRKDGDWAIFKNDNKRALRVFDSELEASIYKKEIEKGSKEKYIIVERPGIDRRCVDYCGVNEHCSYWQKTYGVKK